MLLEDPPWLRREQRSTVAQGRGIRYERKVLKEFCRRYDLFIPKPWFSYLDARSYPQWCQPDGLLVDPWLGHLVIFEVKFNHTPAAAEQLFDVYAPVVGAAFPGFRMFHVEVVRWYDPLVVCSRRVALCEFPDRPKADLFNVHIWR